MQFFSFVAVAFAPALLSTTILTAWLAAQHICLQQESEMDMFQYAAFRLGLLFFSLA